MGWFVVRILRSLTFSYRRAVHHRIAPTTLTTPDYIPISCFINSALHGLFEKERSAKKSNYRICTYTFKFPHLFPTFRLLYTFSWVIDLSPPSTHRKRNCNIFVPPTIPLLHTYYIITYPTTYSHYSYSFFRQLFVALVTSHLRCR